MQFHSFSCNIFSLFFTTISADKLQAAAESNLQYKCMIYAMLNIFGIYENIFNIENEWGKQTERGVECKLKSKVATDINYTKFISKQVKRKKICMLPCVLMLPLLHLIPPSAGIHS